jgi:hypothetical protein
MAGPFRLRCRARVPPELPVLVRDLLLELLRRWNGLPGDPRQPLIDLGRQVGDEAVGEERRHDDAKHRVVDDPGRLVAAVRAALDAIGRIEAEEALVLADRTPEGWMLSPRRKASVPLTAASARTYCQGTKTPSRRARVSTLSSCWSSDLGFEFSSLNRRYARPMSVQTRGILPGWKISAAWARNRRSKSSARVAIVVASAAGTAAVPASSGQSRACVSRYHGVLAPNHKLRPAVTSLAIGNVGKRQEAATRGHTDDGSATGGCCDATHATQKPRAHDTSRIAWAKLMARVGGGVSARVPELRRRHPADRIQTAFRVRNHPWPSHSWQPPVAADF